MDLGAQPWLKLFLLCLLIQTQWATHNVDATVTNVNLPNLVILFADNLGYDDVSIFQNPSSSPPMTPNIDSIGHGGIKMTNWNSAAALCSASRSALLTGKYPIKTGTYPRVFKPGAVYGLLPEEITLAELLKVEGYATSIVGKWHLGHRPVFLPTNQGFDEWTGIPYHMSGGSVDNHVCIDDVNGTLWLPLFQNETIVEQPVKLENLATTYARASVSFIEEHTASQTPFFLYMAFSHVHQLCAPTYQPEQGTCQWAGNVERNVDNATFSSAVEEMDWIAGKILQALNTSGATNNTLVLFTSDNGPWVAEQACAGSKGPFEGAWLKSEIDESCTACPHSYEPAPTSTSPRRCILPGTNLSLEGVHCGEDTGLGSVWEANLRMPALAKFPGVIHPGSESNAMVSTLDVIPTFLSLIGKPVPVNLDGIDVSEVLTGETQEWKEDRALFFWRDGFKDGALPPPYGRFDVAAMKLGRLKAWFWTKSAHYNDDIERFHDPPLLFDVIDDPAESRPLDPMNHQATIERILDLTARHKNSLDWTKPLALYQDSQFLPCADESKKCRTHNPPAQNEIGREGTDALTQ